MKKYLSLIISAFLFFALPTQAAEEIYKLDPSHSSVLWHINHFGFSNPSGKWMANGTLILDKKNPQKSKVNVTIDVSHMITGLPELDDHLKGELFFNVKQFPTATFVSDKVTLEGKNKAKVQGILTLRGISKPITLAVTLNNIAISPINDKETAGFSAKTTIKRSDFGMTGLLPGLGDEVKLDIEAEATKTN